LLQWNFYVQGVGSKKSDPDVLYLNKGEVDKHTFIFLEIGA